ncbi:MAG: Lrp/AsnC family transcriptional regulator [Chloroflexota bacterium]
MVEPDQLDRQIISMLQDDGRCSNREIARSLGVPEATVRYRVRRLTESGLLRITALVEPEKLGYNLTAVISLQVEAEKVPEITQTLSEFPEVMYLVITTGEYDIIFTATFLDREDLYSFLTNRLTNIPGVTRSNTAIGLKIVKRDFEWVSALTASLADPDREIGDVLQEPAAIE